GSGKTIVAVLAMLQMVDAGYQCALLAPTEVLAAQHLRSIRDVLGPLAMGGQLGGAEDATRVALLTGSMTAPQKQQVRDEIAGGSQSPAMSSSSTTSPHGSAVPGSASSKRSPPVVRPMWWHPGSTRRTTPRKTTRRRGSRTRDRRKPPKVFTRDCVPTSWRAC